MNKIRPIIVFCILTAVVCTGIILTSCGGNSMDGVFIITRTAGSADYTTENSLHYIPKTQIVSVDSRKSGASVKILSGNYFSAQSPRISYDGKFMLFAGQKTQNDPWQIFEMDLHNLKTRQVTSSKENCTDPAYLPAGRFLFSQIAAHDSLKGEHSLYISNLDGSGQKRITFNPANYLSSRILNDGRVLTLGRQVFPEQGESMYMVLRPDGTKMELFYKGKEGTTVCGPVSETLNNRIVFTESGSDKRNIISISYNRPLHSGINLTGGIEGDFLYVNSIDAGKLIVSYRKSRSDRYALYEFDPDTKTLGKVLYSDNDYNVTEAVAGGSHDRPKKLPSEVNMGVKTGLLLCEDVNTPNGVTSLPAVKPINRIEIIGIDSTLGVVDIAEDGSFYLKVMADKPFKIRSIDKDGKIHDSCDWMSLRPNERRGCVGCHEDPELVPGNRIPLSVKKSPVIIPMHIKKVVEKKASLE